MSGKPCPSYKLNAALERLVDQLNEENYTRWFISYGTLLGITRDGACIEGDDDIDICCDKRDFWGFRKVLDTAFPEFKWSHHYQDHVFFRKEGYVPIDIYFCHVNDDGDFFDPWEQCLWRDCYEDKDKQELGYIMWHDRKVYVPKNAEKKLENRYGSDWHTRLKKKGTRVAEV